MKKIVCELCEGTEFTKDGGMFVCNGCGIKYTAEEAKGMMKEVEGDAPTLVVGTPAGNPNQQQLENILMLASSAYEADNKSEAENYCNQAIVLDAMCYRAWFLKGKAVGWQSKIDNLRIEEASHSFCKAIDFAPEEEKESLKEQSVEEIRRLGIALISLRKNRFSIDPSRAELNGFTSDQKTVLNALIILLQHGNVVGIPDGYLDEIATLMNEAAVAALNMARNAWKKVEHPNTKDLTTYLDWNGNICSLLRHSISVSDSDEEADITRYENLNIALEDPIGKISYKREWVSWASEYRWFTDQGLASNAVKSRRDEVSRNEKKIREIKDKIAEKEATERRKAEEEKKARIEAYWAAHKDEKDKLDAEKKELLDKKSKFDAEMANLDKKIKDAEAEVKGKVPSENEIEKLNEQRRELVDRRFKLGLFAGKEKKQIGEEIAAIDGRVSALNNKAQEEKKAKKAEIDKKVAPLKAKKEENNKEYSKITKRIAAIDAELTKDPEEK